MSDRGRCQGRGAEDEAELAQRAEQPAQLSFAARSRRARPAPRGRPLPAWSDCRHIGKGELFLMNPAAPDSFDGRYFGVLSTHSVIGRATPVWTDEAGDGDHVWFADPLSNEISTKEEGD